MKINQTPVDPLTYTVCSIVHLRLIVLLLVG